MRAFISMKNLPYLIINWASCYRSFMYSTKILLLYNPFILHRASVFTLVKSLIPIKKIQNDIAPIFCLISL